MAYEFVRQEFDDITVLRGVARYIAEVVGDELAVIEGTTQPAVVLGYQNTVSQAYPRVHLLYDGDDDSTSPNFEAGLVEVEDPDNPPDIITIPYESSYVRLDINIVADSGAIDEVVQGQRKSSSFILRKIRNSLLRDSWIDKFHEYTNCTFEWNNTIIPQTSADGTRYYDSSVMVLRLSTIDTSFDYDGGWFDTIEWRGKLYRINTEDTDPLEVERSVTTEF